MSECVGLRAGSNSQPHLDIEFATIVIPTADSNTCSSDLTCYRSLGTTMWIILLFLLVTVTAFTLGFSLLLTEATRPTLIHISHPSIHPSRIN